MADYSTCRDPTCGTTVEGRPETCAKCGGPMRRLGESKLRAFVLIGTGLFLITFMGWIWAMLWPMLRNPGVEIDGSSFTGSESDARLIELLFAALVLFGVFGLVYGLSMAITGRESSGFKRGVLALAGLLVGIGVVIQYSLG